MKPAKKIDLPKWLWPAIGFTVLAAALIVSGLRFFRRNPFSLTVIPRGNPEIVLHYGAAYRDPGADVLLQGSAFLQDGISPDVQIQTSGEVDTGKVGTYTVRYTARFHDLTASATRTVRVVDRRPPELILEGEPEIDINIGDPYEEPGFTAWDEYDGDLTDSVTSAIEGDSIVYTATDASGNSTSVTRKIHWHDPYLPQINLTGGQTVYINAGNPYVEPGYQAADNRDGDITANVAVTGTVDPYHAGTYILTYSVTDSSFNTNSVTRTVIVSPVPQPEPLQPEGKVIYLTFDDGPGPYTAQLLEVLEKYNVKATFFVMNTKYRHLIGDIVEGGHAIGIHTCTHDYTSIYASEAAFFSDLYGMQEIIYQESGVVTTLMRFPGGSSNKVSSFNPGIMTSLTAAVTDAGFQYHDWNVDSGDAGGTRKTEKVLENVIEGIGEQEVVVVLQHDIKEYSVEAVEQIILWGLENGYTFLPLEPSSPAIHHQLNN